MPKQTDPTERQPLGRAQERAWHESMTTKAGQGQDCFFCSGIDLLKRQNAAAADV